MAPFKTRLAQCGHEVPSHPGRARTACDECRADVGHPPQTWAIVCWGCGDAATAGHQSQRYCSLGCRDGAIAAARAERIEAKRVHKNCKTCDVSLTGRSSTAIFCSIRCADVARGARRPEPFHFAVCALDGCDVEFQLKKTGQRACSEPHGKKLWHQEHPNSAVWNDKRRDSYHRRRAQKAGTSSADRPVLLSEIRERDGNRCHLCLKKVSAKPYPHPLSASLDHVVPLSLDGEHVPENVRLAHLRCNVAKGNGGGNEQLLLIG